MVVANLAMNGYPVMLQRYNRILLARRYRSWVPAVGGGPGEVTAAR
jgi:hypothetical protein